MDLKQGAGHPTPKNPGHIRVSTKPKAVQVLSALFKHQQVLPILNENLEVLSLVRTEI